MQSDWSAVHIGLGECRL